MIFLYFPDFGFYEKIFWVIAHGYMYSAVSFQEESASMANLTNLTLTQQPTLT